jgi:hypothetical protein
MLTVTTDWHLPTQVRQDDSVGSTEWSFPDEIKINDMEFAPENAATNFFLAGGDAHRLAAALLTKGEVIGGDDKSGLEIIISNEYINLGANNDLWSETWTPAEIMAEGFGMAIAYDDDSSGIIESWYIIGQAYGFEIPSNATILGIEVEIHNDVYAGGGGTSGIALDSIKVRVTYEYEPIVEAFGQAGGEVYIADTGQETPQKKVRYLVFDSDNNFVGEWTKNVLSEISFKRQINNPLSTMDVRLGRTELTQSVITEPLLTEDDEPILTEGDQPILVDIVAALGLGAGTDLDLNFNVDVVAYWGTYEPLLTEDDEPILTEDDRYILVESGEPNGRTVFSGYVSDWELDFGTDDVINVPLLNHGNELNHIMLETQDEIIIDNSELVDNTWGESAGIAGSGPGDFVQLAQSFRMPATKLVSRITLYVRAGWTNSDLEFQVSLWSGTPAGALTDLSTGGVGVVSEYLGYQTIDIVFDEPISLTNATDYTMIFDTDNYKTGGNPTYPVNFKMGGSLANAQAYYDAGSGWVSFGSGVDFAFILWEQGTDTTVPFLSYDPSQIAREVIDFARLKGAHINYDESSIEDTGTEVSYTFNANTIKEALDKILELCPADWFWTYDVGTNLYSLKPRPESPDRYFTKKQDIVKMKLRRSIARLINQVYFTGGGDPALFRKLTDVQARLDWRAGLAKLSDRRVTDNDTADIISQSLIDRQKDPEYIGTATISGNHYDNIEDILLGDETGFINFGNFIDNISLQIVEITYLLDTVDVGFETILPPVTKRVEDIKRNLDVLEQENNPASPS